MQKHRPNLLPLPVFTCTPRNYNIVTVVVRFTQIVACEMSN